MSELSNRLDKIVERTKRLITEYDDLKEANEQLKAENENLKLSQEQFRKANEELINKIKILKLAKNISSEETGNKKEIKEKINELIKEIDKCIGMLNN